MIKLGDRLKEDICIECVELTITYSIYNQLIELNTNTYENHSPSLSILDQEFDNSNNGVKIELSNLNEINLLIKDFENKFKQLIKK